MRKLLLVALSILPGWLYAQDKFSIKEPETMVLQTVKLGFAVPDIPAFKALNLDPSKILRPSEAKDIALMFGSFRSDGDFIVPKNLAVEITPGLLINPWYTLEDYQTKGLLRAFTKTRLSFGTNEDSKTGINNLAFGLRTTLVDKADFRMDARLMTDKLFPMLDSFTRVAFNVRLAMGEKLGADSLKRIGAADRQLFDSAVVRELLSLGVERTDPQFKALIDASVKDSVRRWGDIIYDRQPDQRKNVINDSINKIAQNILPLDKEYEKAIERYKNENWNAAKMDFAYSLVLQSPDSLLGHVKFNRHQFWLAYATRPGKNNNWAQLLFSINEGMYSYQSEMYNEFTGNFRFYAGKNRVKGFFETQYQNLSNPFNDRVETLYLQLGAEVNFFKGVWLHFGTGILNALKGDNRSQLLSNLNLFLTIPEDFKLFN